jgi:hypothetical protein
MKERQAAPRSYTTEYGTIEVAAGGFRRSEGGWFRYDRFTPHDPDSGFGGRDSIFALSDRDISPQHRGYDAACSCCWLGFGHTVAFHDRSVRRGGG